MHHRLLLVAFVVAGCQSPGPVPEADSASGDHLVVQPATADRAAVIAAAAPTPRPAIAPWSLTASDGSGLAVVRVEAKAVVEGPLALTELHLYFRNTENRVREGRFAITLPERAAVSRFAMEIGDRMQEAEVVPKALARRVYEDFLHRKQDPALLEKSAGNEFTARVFPIPARAVKHLIIAFSQELAGEYVLPLRGLPVIERVDVQLDAIKLDGTRARHELHERAWQPDRDFTAGVVGPAAIGAGGIVAARLASTATATAADAPRAVTLLVDTSASRALGYAPYLDSVRELVATLRRRHGDFALQLVAFDQTTQPIFDGPVSALANTHWNALLDRGAEGASDLGAALAALTRHHDRIVIVTDGVVTAGPEQAELAATLARLGGRVDVVLAGGIRDDALAAALARAGTRAGAVLDLDRGAGGVAIGLAEPVVTDVAVAVAGATWIYPRVIPAMRPGGDPVTVYARFATPPRTVAVAIGNDRRTLDVAAATPALVGRAVAGAEIAELEHRLAAGDTTAQLRDDIARRSVAARVVSTQTAMLVLETDADYTRYHIERTALADILVVGPRGIEQTRRTDLVTTRPAPEPRRDDSPTFRPVEEDAMPADARAQAIDTARSAGTLGSAAVGNELGDAYESQGSFGFGRTGFGPGGGGTGAGYGIGSGRGGMRGRTAAVPTMRLGQPVVTGDLDKAIIRRYLKRNANKLQYCYERELLARPGITGTITAVFVIGPIGHVAQSTATGFDPVVARCVADVISKIEFPKGKGGGQVQVSYPITFLRPEPAPSIQSAAQAAPDRGPPALTGKLAEVTSAIASKQVDRAVAIAQRWRAEAPGDLLAIVAVGEALEARGRGEEAARVYGSIIDLHPARVDMRRFAGQRLERLADRDAVARRISIDTYRRAVADRPDHVTGHRLLAYALVRAGDHAGAFAAILAGHDRLAEGRHVAGADRVLGDDAGIIARAYLAHGGTHARVDPELAKRSIPLATAPSTRFVLYWETDANDVDFHIRDARGGHAFYAQPSLGSGGTLYADVTTGYGPECFAIPDKPTAGPYELSLHYYSQGPMGFGMGLLQIQRFDGNDLAFEDRPYVIMADRAFVSLGTAR